MLGIRCNKTPGPARHAGTIESWQRVYLVFAAFGTLGFGEPSWATPDEDAPPRWTQRRPGGALPPLPPTPPIGWRYGLLTTAPLSAGVTTGYIFPADPVGLKLSAAWSVWTPDRLQWNPLDGMRLSAAAMYYIAPAHASGPYVEAGLAYTRLGLATRPLPWPLVPQVGFGVTGHGPLDSGWDLSLVALADGLLALEFAWLR